MMTQVYIFLISFISLFSIISSATSQTCKALILQGGSDKGAYQAGVLEGLLHELGPQEVAYDVVTGVTIGAINTAWISQFAKGEEEAMVQALSQFWLTMKSSDISVNWNGGIAQGFLFKPSLFDASPTLDYLKKHITKEAQRYVAIGTTNMNQGSYRAFNNFKENFSTDRFASIVTASNAVAGIFPYIEMDNSTYSDGSILKSMEIASAVDKCREITGKNDSNIIIDIILLSSKSLRNDSVEGLNSMQVLMRTLNLMSYHDALIGLIRAQQSYPNVQFRYVISPSQSLPSGYRPYNFDHSGIVKMLKLGHDDAVKAVSSGKGASFREVLKEAYDKVYMKYGMSGASNLMNKYFDLISELAKEDFVNQA